MNLSALKETPNSSFKETKRIDSPEINSPFHTSNVTSGSIYSKNPYVETLSPLSDISRGSIDKHYSKSSSKKNYRKSDKRHGPYSNGYPYSSGPYYQPYGYNYQMPPQGYQQYPMQYPMQGQYPIPPPYYQQFPIQENTIKIGTDIPPPQMPAPPKEEPPKSSKPNYNIMSDDEISKIRNIFEERYTKLSKSYPTWQIKLPDFNNDHIEIIHDRYEKTVTNILISQRAQKLKVMLAIIFTSVEYLLFIKWKWAIMKNFAKMQLKTLHRYDSYLIEIATKLQSTEDDKWPFLLRMSGTLGLNFVIFGAINSFCGNGSSMAESVHGIADQYITSLDEDVVHNKDGISEVPDIPSGIAAPDSLLKIINMYANLNTKPSDPIPEPVHAQEIPIKKSEKPEIKKPKRPTYV